MSMTERVRGFCSSECYFVVEFGRRVAGLGPGDAMHWYT